MKAIELLSSQIGSETIRLPQLLKVNKHNQFILRLFIFLIHPYYRVSRVHILVYRKTIAFELKRTMRHFESDHHLYGNCCLACPKDLVTCFNFCVLMFPKKTCETWYNTSITHLVNEPCNPLKLLLLICFRVSSIKQNLQQAIEQ